MNSAIIFFFQSATIFSPYIVLLIINRSISCFNLWFVIITWQNKFRRSHPVKFFHNNFTLYFFIQLRLLRAQRTNWTQFRFIQKDTVPSLSCRDQDSREVIKKIHQSAGLGALKRSRTNKRDLVAFLCNSSKKQFSRLFTTRVDWQQLYGFSHTWKTWLVFSKAVSSLCILQGNPVLLVRNASWRNNLLQLVNGGFAEKRLHFCILFNFMGEILRWTLRYSVAFIIYDG